MTRINASAGLSTSSNGLLFPFQNSAYRRYCGREERHLVGVCKHLIVIGRSKRARKTRRERLAELPDVMFNVVIPAIDRVNTDRAVFRFLTQAAPAVPFPIHANPITDTP